MNRFLSLAGLLVVLWLPCTANAEAVVPKINGVIQQQLEAFRKNDFKTAYGFAHSGIKGQFALPDFERMVRGGFPQMLQPGAVEFGEIRNEGGNAAVQATLTGEDGSRSAYLYLLEMEGGEWRITGVVPLETGPSESLV